MNAKCQMLRRQRRERRAPRQTAAPMATYRQPRRRRQRPPLRFTPYAWAKLLHLRDEGPTEVGGFGVTAEADPLLVEDVRLVGQSCTPIAVRFDDAAVADFFDACVDEGLPPERFARVWVHTHPGDSPRPSGTDERTFARAFGGCDWAAMVILAAGGDSYARLRFSAGPGADLVIPIELDFSATFPSAAPAAWAEEYERCVANGSEARAAACGAAREPARRDLAAASGPAPSEIWPSGSDFLDPELYDFDLPADDRFTLGDHPYVTDSFHLSPESVATLRPARAEPSAIKPPKDPT